MKAQARDLLQQVREQQEPIEITSRGEVIARITPAAPHQVDPEALAAWWARWDKLGQEISKYWPEGVSAVDAVRDVRRDL